MVTRILNFLLLSFCLGNIKTKHQKSIHMLPTSGLFGFPWLSDHLFLII